MDRTAVRFDQLTKSYGGVRALSGLSATVPSGSITALLGRNGAGKTTALKCLVGLLRPDSGRAIVLGKSGTDLDVATRSRIGYVSERQNLERRLTVAELIDYTAAFYPDWDVALADDLLERLDLVPDQLVGFMSQGEGRKLSLLLNLAFRPELLVLDEPAANLDAIVRREFLETVLELFRSEGMTVLLSTHLLSDVERIADRVILVQQGELQVESGLDDLKDRVKAIRFQPQDGRPISQVSLPGVLTKRRAGNELLVTVENYSEVAAAAAAAAVGARFDLLDLPLEEIFIAYGSMEQL